MALPTFQGQGAGNATASIASLSVPYPASLVRNDYLILHVTVRNTTTTVAAPDATWSTIQTAIGAGSTTTGRHWIFGKKSEGTESGNLTVAFGSDAAVCKTARMYYFRNVDVVTPTEGGSTTKATGTTVSATSLVTSGTDRLGLHFLYVTDDNAVASFAGETGGDWTEAVAEYTTTLGSDTCIQLQTAGLAAATTISGGTLTMAATDPYGCATVALRNGTEQRYVWDNIGLTDAITAAMSINILNPTPPGEGIDLGETVTVNLPAIPLEINIYDGITLEDTENVLYPVTVIIGEVVTVLIDVVPAPSQGVAVGETVAINKDIVPSVSDGIDISAMIVAALSDPSPSVDQGIDINETVTAQLSAAADLVIDISQGINVSDIASLLKDILPSVYDGIDAGEAVVVSLGGPSIDVNDGIGAAENVSALKDIMPSVFDGIEIGESLTVLEYGGGPSPNVYDGIGVSDAANILYPITITLTEVVTVEISGVPPEISVQQNIGVTDSLTVVKDSMPEGAESIGVTDIAAVNKDVNPFLYDDIGVAETLNVVCAAPNNISVYDGIGVTDTENVLYPITIVVGETIAISWITYPGFLYNYERIGVSESVEVFSGGIGINVYDGIAVHEANYYVPFVTQDIGTSDIATVFFSWLNLNVYETVRVHDASFPPGDQVTITEVVTVSMDVSTILYPNVADTVAIAETINVDTPILIADKQEAIGINENVQITMNLGGVSVYDGIGIAEDITAGIIESGYLQVFAYDNAGMGETVGKSLELAEILKHETIGIREVVTVLKNIYAAVSDSIEVGEFQAVVLDVVAPILIINSPDSIGTAEAVSILIDILPSITDGIALSDVPELAQDILIDVIDLIGAAEDMVFLFGTNLPINQAIAIREYLDLYIETKVEAAQNIALREVHFVEMELPGFAPFDRVATREYVAVRTEQAVGRASITFGYKKPRVNMTNKKPDITFGTKVPTIAFTGE